MFTLIQVEKHYFLKKIADKEKLRQQSLRLEDSSHLGIIKGSRPRDDVRFQSHALRSSCICLFTNFF